MSTSILHLRELQTALMEKVPHGLREDVQRQVVSGLGLMEETHEYLNSLGHKPWRPEPLPRADQLEELTDILFFWLELWQMSGFSWNEIVEQYCLKHQENLKRYEALERGDTSWDKRREKDEL